MGGGETYLVLLSTVAEMSPALAFYMYIDHCTQNVIDLCSLV